MLDAQCQAEPKVCRSIPHCFPWWLLVAERYAWLVVYQPVRLSGPPDQKCRAPKHKLQARNSIISLSHAFHATSRARMVRAVVCEVKEQSSSCLWKAAAVSAGAGWGESSLAEGDSAGRQPNPRELDKHQTTFTTTSSHTAL